MFWKIPMKAPIPNLFPFTLLNSGRDREGNWGAGWGVRGADYRSSGVTQSFVAVYYY